MLQYRDHGLTLSGHLGKCWLIVSLFSLTGEPNWFLQLFYLQLFGMNMTFPRHLYDLLWVKLLIKTDVYHGFPEKLNHRHREKNNLVLVKGKQG